MPSEFETIFSDLAYAFLRQSNIDVSKYLIGFEIVDHNEAKTKGLGMFAIKIGKKYYYIPVFFNNGEVKPLLMMYDKEADMMLPLDTEWVEFLEKSTSPVIGRSHPEIPPESSQVNLRRFLQPPFIGKLASENEDKYFNRLSGETRRVFKGMSESYFIKRASDYALPDFLSKSNYIVKNAFLKLMRDDNRLLKAVCNTYGLDRIKEACKIDTIEKKSASNKISVIDDMKDAVNLEPREKISFMRNGYFIVDERDVTEKKAAYDFELTGIAESPSATGIYEFMTDSGKTKNLVIIHPYDMRIGRNNKDAVVVDLKSLNYTRMPIHELIVYQRDGSPYETIQDLPLVNIEGMKVNSSYVLLNSAIDVDRGNTTEPFTVKKKTKGTDGAIYYSVDQNNFDEVNILVKDAGKLTRLGRDLIVPRHFKALKVNADTLRVFGRPEMVDKIEENYDRMKVASMSVFKNDKFIEKYASNKDLELALVKDHGLSVDDARKHARDTKLFWTKKAFVTPVHGAVGIPEHVGRGFFDGEAPGGVQEVEYNVYSGENKTPRMELANTYNNVKNEIGRAVSLSDNGMKDVFDKALLGTMTKLTDIDSELRSFIPDLMTGLDKLARILFVFWHKPDKIKDKFSLNEFSESEDILKDTFKNLGQIILDLKKKYMDYE